jgi:hypothetical protein
VHFWGHGEQRVMHYVILCVCTVQGMQAGVCNSSGFGGLASTDFRCKKLCWLCPPGGP